MIKITNKRREAGSGYKYEPVIKEETPEEALVSLVNFELGYGGKIIELSETRIVTSVTLLGKIDDTVFEGSKEEMEILLIACKLWYETCKKVSLKSEIDLIFEKFGNNTMSPLIATTLGTIMIGKNRVKGIIALALGFEKDQLEKLYPLESKDIVAIKELMDDNMPFEEAFKLAV